MAKNIGDMIDALTQLRADKAASEEVTKGIEAKIAALHTDLFALMDKQGVTRAAGKVASISITESIEANVDNWDVLWPWLAKTKNFQLVQRRISGPAFREIMEIKGAVPGTTPVKVRKLNFRST